MFCIVYRNYTTGARTFKTINASSHMEANNYAKSHCPAGWILEEVF